MPNNKKSPSLTGAALARLASPPKSQCSTWAEKPETHEQLAVGQETSRSMQKTKEFLKDHEKNIKSGAK